MKILIHCCCAPCAVAPLEVLCKEHEILLYFYNPNIHPFDEFQKRLDTFQDFAQNQGLPHIIDSTYIGEENWAALLPSLVFKERCPTCYKQRLEQAIKVAAENKCHAYTSSLLYSKYQLHEEIVRQAPNKPIPFFYEDFRPLWYHGINLSKTHNMYRQKYCGCYLSRQETLKDKK